MPRSFIVNSPIPELDLREGDRVVIVAGKCFVHRSIDRADLDPHRGHLSRLDPPPMQARGRTPGAARASRQRSA